MKATLDVSRAPRGELVAARLVAATAAGDDRIERHYLELKSELDLTKKTDIAKIAKYILASANRSPEVAALAFEGYGVMVIGVAPGEIRGVPPVEILDIDKVVSKFIGAAGPHWDLVRVPVKDSKNEVLVIVIDPPRLGQGPFLCRANGEGLADGAVYIRAEGATRIAKADEVDLLIKRGTESPPPDISFEVTIDGVATPVKVDVSNTVEAYVDDTARKLIAALPKPEPEPEIDDVETSTDTRTESTLSAYRNPGVSRLFEQQGLINMAAEMARTQAAARSALTSSALTNLTTTEPEERTEQQYRLSIEKWTEATGAKWPAAVDVFTGHLLRGFDIRVKNSTKTFFHDVEVKIHLEGPVRGIDTFDADRIGRADLDLPEPPREWGPVTRSKFDIGTVLPRDFPMSNSYIGSNYHSPLDWHNSGSIDLRLDVGELRPREEYVFDDQELALVLPADFEGETIVGTWQITARDHNEIYEGSLEVQVDRIADFTIALRKLLSLEASE